VDRITRCGDTCTAIRNSTYHEGCIRDPILEKGGSRGSSIILFVRATVVCYTLPIVTIASSLTIRPQFAIEYIRRGNQEGWVTLGQNFGGVPFGIGRDFGIHREWTLQANSKWNYFRRIPTYLITLPRRHEPTDRRRDRQFIVAIGEIAYKRRRLKTDPEALCKNESNNKWCVTSFRCFGK